MPFRLLKSFHKIQQRLVRELEKKFSGKDVVLIANRRIMAPPTNGVSNSRPRSRTLTAVCKPIVNLTHANFATHCETQYQTASIMSCSNYVVALTSGSMTVTCWHQHLKGLQFLWCNELV